VASLTKQYEALSELEGAAGGDPAKMAEQKLDFLAKLVTEARQRLNKKAEVYSRAQYQRANLLLDNLDKQVDNQRQLIGTLEPARRGKAGGDPSAVDMTKVNTTATRLSEQLAKSGTEEATAESLRTTIARGRHTPAERALIVQELLRDDPRASLSAGKRVGALADQEGLTKEEYLTGELMRPFDEDDAAAAQVLGADDPGAAVESIPDPQLRRRIKEMHFQADPDNPGEFLLDASGRPVLEDTAAMAAERRLTTQGLERSYGDMADTINQLVRGSGGGDFANEMKDILSSYGAGSVDELFARYGLDTASLQAREDALRGKYGGERADIAAELRKLAVAPKAPVARAAFEVMQDPSFSAEMEKRGYKDPTAGLRAMAKEAGQTMRTERKETRQQARARLARPRVEATIREKLYGQRGPQVVDT
tara:strand:- start:96 stop:1364 length:1269 start_codon:yes stop_codon:yes gene_type:complete